MRGTSSPEACVKGSIVWSWFGAYQRHRRQWCVRRLRCCQCVQQPKVGEVEVDSYALFAHRGRQRLTKGGFHGPGCFNNSRPRPSYYIFPRETQRTKVRAREAFGRHGAGCVTTFSEHNLGPMLDNPKLRPAPCGGLAWAFME